MKFTSMFFTASAKHLRCLSSKIATTSKKHEVYFDVFYGECQTSSMFTIKDSEKMSYLFNFTILCTLFRKNSTIFTVIYKYVIKSSII